MTKKIISAVMAVTLGFGAAAAVLPAGSAFSMAVTASAEDKNSGKCGEEAEWVLDGDTLTDVNNDGNVNVTDLNLVAARVKGIRPLS
ncbi:hypothetical protein [Ruminococcus sp.]|uniref:hypothetical protein n=1 Tax=Ruminococcus sp. TaxID=41978 RepID=UPI0025F2D04E|nr:hypothetical protein [Ruminococcus sp.]MBQ8964981.1 hypothetical protein [Ruminococcus sp.]